MAYVLTTISLPVTEVPFEACYFIARWIGGRGARKRHGIAFAHRIEGEVGGRLRDNLNIFSFGAARLVANSDGASVNTSHFHGAVGYGGILYVGGEVIGTSPTKGGTYLVLGSQLYGFSNTIGTATIHQWRQDATVCSARADVFKGNVAWVVGEVGDEQNIILSRQCVVDVAMLCWCGTVTAIDNIAARKLVTCCGDVVEGSPTIKVDVDQRCTIHVDIQVARLVDSQVIESWVRCSGKAIG